jgi:cell division protein FtsB
MDNLFFRKDQASFDVRKLIRKFLKNKRAVLAVCLGLPLVLFLFFGNHGVIQRVKLQHQKTELETKIGQAEEETRNLQAESKALDGDKKAIEKVAREKYGMIRDGETVYKVKRK